MKPYHLVDFAVAVSHRVKAKETGKIDKYQDLAKELLKLWNRMVIVIPILVET